MKSLTFKLLTRFKTRKDTNFMKLKKQLIKYITAINSFYLIA